MCRVRIQRETPAHVAAVRETTEAAFARPDQSDRSLPEVALLDQLRAHDAWLPALSLVALDASGVVGHVLCTRAWVDTAPALALGPLSVHPEHQRRGVGSALVHAVLGAADALDEPLVVLLGDPRYYSRFGFRLAGDHGIASPRPEWRSHLQARTLTAYPASLTGRFDYADPFYRV